MFWIEKEELSKLLSRHVCAGVPGTTGCIRPDGGCAVVDLGLALRHAWLELETEIGLGQRQAVACLELMRELGEMEDRLRDC